MHCLLATQISTSFVFCKTVLLSYKLMAFLYYESLVILAELFKFQSCRDNIDLVLYVPIYLIIFSLIPKCRYITRQLLSSAVVPMSSYHHHLTLVPSQYSCRAFSNKHYNYPQKHMKTWHIFLKIYVIY